MQEEEAEAREDEDKGTEAECPLGMLRIEHRYLRVRQEIHFPL